MTTLRLSSVLAVAVLGLTLLAGCSSVSPGVVRLDPAPEMNGIADTTADRLNRRSYVVNTDWRELQDDWDRFWLLDEPVRNSLYPIP